METLFNIVNFFLVPCISVLIYGRRHPEAAGLSALWLVRYAVFAVVNIMITQIGILAVRFFLHREIFQASIRYTVASACVAAVLPFVWDILGAAAGCVSFHVEPRKRQ